MLHFITCNDKSIIMPDDQRIAMSDEVKAFYLNQSFQSGLISDQENDIYIREGYGAVVGVCPDNCNNISDVINFTVYDLYRKKVGKPSIFEKLLGHTTKDAYFAYGRYIEEEGYDLIIGPGGYINGEKFNKLIYCKNYLDILETEKNRIYKSR